MKWYGLTGGIASGKSTVSRMLRERGVRVIDADAIAREVVAPGQPALAALAEAFGAAILRPDGALDRPQLARLAFTDDAARARLSAITHPAIGARTAALLDEARAAGEPFAVYDAALIVENNLHEAMDGLIVVSLPADLQRARLRARDGLDDAAARARLAAQSSTEDKVRLADWVIDNSGDLDATREQVEAVLAALRAHARA